jgi:hypothetical protein
MGPGRARGDGPEGMSPCEAVSPGHACVGEGAARGAVSGAERSKRWDRRSQVWLTGCCSSHWWFTNTYNIQVFQSVSRCFLPTHHDDYTPCPDKPLIISGWWYSAEVVSGGTSGEVSDSDALHRAYLLRRIVHSCLDGSTSRGVVSWDG